MCFKRNKTVQRVLLLMPLLLFILSILQVFIFMNIIQKGGFDPAKIFNTYTIVSFIIAWLLISIIPVFIYYRTVRKQCVVLENGCITLQTAKENKTLLLSEVKEVKVYRGKRRINAISLDTGFDTLVIGDFEQKEKMVELLEKDIDTLLFKTIYN